MQQLVLVSHETRQVPSQGPAALAAHHRVGPRSRHFPSAGCEKKTLERTLSSKTSLIGRRESLVKLKQRLVRSFYHQLVGTCNQKGWASHLPGPVRRLAAGMFFCGEGFAQHCHRGDSPTLPQKVGFPNGNTPFFDFNRGVSNSF